MEEQLYEITLVCFSCGKKKEVFVSNPPQFAFELASIANDAGMRGAIDLKHHRTLVFCDDVCAMNQLTKKGTFRVRPKKIVPKV